MERINKFYLIIGLAITCCLFFGIAANADELDESTTITFSGPVEVPGQVLPAGTYLFKLADNGSDPNLVEIFNADGTRLHATLETIPTDLQKATDHTTVTLTKQGSGTPDALLKWIYPGDLTGHEFLYSAQQKKELVQNRQQTIVTHVNSTNSEAQAGE
jgi:hypothetical protein